MCLYNWFPHPILSASVLQEIIGFVFLSKVIQNIKFVAVLSILNSQKTNLKAISDGSFVSLRYDIFTRCIGRQATGDLVNISPLEECLKTLRKYLLDLVIKSI